MRSAAPITPGLVVAVTLAIGSAPVTSAAGPAIVPASRNVQAGAVEGGDDVPGFVDVTAAAGIDFRHVNGAFGDKWMPESLGAGVAVFDADGDGWSDLLFVQGGPWPGYEEAVPESMREATMRLYRNLRDGTFADATAGSGLDVPMYGFGAAPGDYDNDGAVDVYVTAYGRNRLFRNVGQGEFRDVTDPSGVGHEGWGTSAAWFDYDRDGDLDLYLANYVRWAPDDDIWCSLDGTNKSYCTPESYVGEPSVLYRNEGEGRFVDVSREARVFVPGGKSLGVTVADFNDDGWMDFAVANDTEPNFLFENRRDGTFEEVGLTSGMAFDVNGRARAGMGIDVAESPEPGRARLAIGNFSKEMIGLFARQPGGLFIDDAARAGIGRTSFSSLTFALFFFDFDLDGALDLFAVNGHLEQRINEVEPSITYAQRPLLYRSDGNDGRFEEMGARTGQALARPIVGRGGAYGDLDRDGDLDIVMTTNDGPPVVLQNRARDTEVRPHVLRVRLQGVDSNRQAIGASVTVRAAGRVMRRSVRSGSSYASQSELTLTFGLGAARSIDGLAVRWPDGDETTLSTSDLADIVDHEIVLDEARGLLERVPLTRRAP